jgi:hypothetical protein
MTSYAAIDQDVTDEHPTAEPTPLQRAQEIEPPSVLERFDIRGFVDVQQGYDNNVDLDPSRHSDGFLQTIANGEIVYSANENIDIKAGSDLFNLIYYKYNVDNILDISPYIAVDTRITPDVIWRNRFTYDYFSYPNDKESTFSGIKYSSYLRHYFLPEVYHEVGGEFLTRWFPDRVIATENAQLGNEDRKDSRYRFQYNIGGFFYDFFIRVSNEYSRNDSNYSYQEYYDYQAYRLRPSIMYFFNDKLYSDVSLTYKYFDYKDRRNTETPDETVDSHTFIFGVSAYYDLTGDMTLGMTYSYSENVSNDPFEEYSGSIISGGIFYSF